MKKNFIILLIILFPTIVFAQGYKEYTWGMSPEEVKNLAPDLKASPHTYWDSPTRILLFFYSKEIISSIPDPMEYEIGNISRYNSNSTNLEFYFINNKLRGVSFFMWGEDIYSSLVEKYGKVTPVSSMQMKTRYKTACWEDDKRIIYWEEEQSAYIETVQYIDSQWLSPLLEKTISDYRDKKKQIKSKLD